MRSIATTRVLPLLAPLAALQTLASVLPPRADKITWGECKIETDTAGLPVQCGKLTVPLDYTDRDNGKTIDLELIKYPAAKQPAPKGSILLNFGGPGGDGLNNFILNVPLQLPIIGDEHDLISWDPRGTRNTLPVICFDNTPLNQELVSYLSDWYNASSTTPSQLWSEATLISQLCASRLKEVGPYLGMASVAHDMISIVDALPDNDKLLRYWGISGGTSLGATVAAMFPERMDKIILDGVMNVHEYYNSLAETEFISSADDVLRGIFEGCVSAGVEKCPLAKHGASKEELEKKVDQLVYDLKFNQIPFIYPPLGSGLVVEYNMFFNWVFTKLYFPKSYQDIATAIEGLFRRDARPFLEKFFGASLETLAEGIAAQATSGANLTEALSSLTNTEPIIRAVWGIRCGDRRPRAKSRDELEPLVRKLEDNSKWFAHFGLAPNAYLCAQWEFEAAERYEGGFTGIKTKNPVLFVGNTHDPVTPLVSARNVSSGFEGSVVLQHDSYGHVSFYTQASNCTYNAISQYLSEGKMPAEGTVCKPDIPVEKYITGEFQSV